MIVPITQHAGDTKNASTITIEQTGPLQLTVRAGTWTTPGRQSFAPIAALADPASLVAAGLAEYMPDGQRLRLWVLDQNGQPIERSVAYTLPADVVFTLTADPTDVKEYQFELGLFHGACDVLCRSRIAGEALPLEPAGWVEIHWLGGLTLPAEATDLTAIPVSVFTILPDFPPGEGVVWGYTPDGQFWQRVGM